MIQKARQDNQNIRFIRFCLGSAYLRVHIMVIIQTSNQTIYFTTSTPLEAEDWKQNISVLRKDLLKLQRQINE